MAQSGYTPIQLYYSTTALATPSAGNLASGELAINITDEKLYFKNAAGTVKLLASTSGASGSVTSVSVVSANGFAGTVANSTTTPAITLSTTISGLLKGNGTAISAASSGTDYAPPTSGTSILYGNGSGGFSNVTIGSGISFAGGTLSATGAGGTVTSVALSGGTTGLTVSGSPITTSGTITLAGTLAVANGGTGQTTYTNGQLLIGNSTGNTLTKATLTAGSGISISNGAGSITISSSAGGGVSVYSNVNTATTYTLTSSSNQTIEIDAQAYGIKVVLPDATTMTPKSAAFVIRNVGYYPIVIEDATNVCIGGVPAGFDVPCNLNTNSTAAGSWVLSQDACYVVETSLVGITVPSPAAIKRLSSTKFFMVGADLTGTSAFQAFTISNGIITAGTVYATGLSGTFVEAVRIDDNRVLVTYWSSPNLYHVVIDATNINSVSVGSVATSATAIAASPFRFNERPINAYNYQESTLQVSGRLTGTNIFCYYYRTNANYTELISIDVGSSGTGITVSSPDTYMYGSTSSMIHLGATVISSSTVGLATIFDSTTNGYCYGITAQLTGTTWSSNQNNFANASGTLANSKGMIWNNQAIVGYFRSNLNQVFALEFPASGNAAPTSSVVAFGGSYSSPQNIIKTSQGIVLAQAGTGAVMWYSYSFGVAPAYVNDNVLNTVGTSTNFTGRIDPEMSQTFQVAVTNMNVLCYLNTSTNSIDLKWLNPDNATRTVTTLQGFPGYSNRWAMLFNHTAATVGNTYQKFMRVTTDSTPKISPLKNYGWNKWGSYGQSSLSRYFSQLGKYIFAFDSRNQILTPMSATSVNGFLGESGFKDYQSNTYLATDQYADAINSSEMVYFQTQIQGDTGIPALQNDSNGAPRIALLRVANT